MPGLDQRIDDLRAVMDAADMPQAAVMGLSEGGSLAALFAATYPKRCSALILCGAFARFSSWFPTEEAFARFLGYIDQAWGSGVAAPFFVPSRADDPAFQRWFGRLERLGATPATVAAYMRMNSQIDISGVLPTIQAPTLVVHRTGDVTINIEAGRYLAEHIPSARLVEFPGNDHPLMFGDNANETADVIQEFLTGTRGLVEIDRMLATVLFTDIVGSTEKAAALGDSRWRNLLDSHHGLIKRNLARFRGHEIKSTGDGILATFDGPARGVRCAYAITEESARSELMFAPASILVSARSWARTWAESPFTLEHASHRSQGLARCWSPER
jgi:esterase/lipase